MSHGSLDRQPLGLGVLTRLEAPSGLGRNCSLAAAKWPSDLDGLRSSEESMVTTLHSFILTVK